MTPPERLTYDQVLGRLESIEQDLADRQQGYENAAREFHRYTRDYELRIAQVSLGTNASTATEKKWRALDAIAAADDDLYEDLKNAEGIYEGCKAAVRVLEQRASISQSLLKAASREVGA
jgi:hypothetical protein